MARFTVNAAFWGAAFIRERHLLEGDAQSDMIVNDPALIGGRHPFEIRLLLEEVQYQY